MIWSEIDLIPCLLSRTLSLRPQSLGGKQRRVQAVGRDNDENQHYLLVFHPRRRTDAPIREAPSYAVAAIVRRQYLQVSL